MRVYLHIFFALSFILSGISPACAFISGKSSFDIEICTVDGLKTITVPGDTEPQENPSHPKKNDCAFCFVQSHLKSAKADSINIALSPELFSDAHLFPRPAHIKRAELLPLAARGPPLQF